MSSNEGVTTIILGGGQGTRLFPLTSYRSKPAVPIGGLFRLVDIPISNSLNSGLNKIFVLTQFNSVSLHRHLHRSYPYGMFDGMSIELLAAEQTLSTADWFQGTADAVRKHFHHYPLASTKTFLVLSGDHLYRMDYRHILDYHEKSNADVTIATLPVTKKEVSGFGIMKLKANGQITEFREKPSPKDGIEDFVIPEPMREVFQIKGQQDRYLASMGIYVFKADVLKQALAGRETDFGREVIPKAIENFRVMGYVFKGYWRDIGTIGAFYEANIELTRPNPPFTFSSDEGRIFTRARFLPQTCIHEAEISNCLISHGCCLSGVHLEDSIIGLRSKIGAGTVVRKSVVMGNDFYEFQTPKGAVSLGIGQNCQIQGAILDKNVYIGNDVTITNQKKVHEFDGENYYIRDGIVIVPKAAVIRNGTVI
ncbi:MAG: glucose-1-phosphate adenylyltransferase [Candidatus Omnitrophota bacterium]